MTEPSRYADPQKFLDRLHHFAVIDASNDRAREGFHIYAALKAAGFIVTPVNPQEKTVQGDVCFPNLGQIRPFADTVIFTAPPAGSAKRGMEVLRDMRDNGIFRIWIEPKNETPEMLRFIAEYHLEVLTGFSLRDELLKPHDR